MRYLSTVFLLSLLLIGCSSCAGRQFPDQVPTMSDPAVVKLIAIAGGEEAGYCTAWKLSENRIMTAGHCCDKDTQYTASGPHAIPGQELKVLYAHEDDPDICVMEGKILGAPIRLAQHDPTIGQAVWTAGYPRTQFLISSGYWSGRREDGMAIASVAVYGGASGSPVMNANGEAVGVLVAYYPPMSNLALLTPLEWMRSAVQLAGKGN